MKREMVLTIQVPENGKSWIDEFQKVAESVTTRLAVEGYGKVRDYVRPAEEHAMSPYWTLTVK